MKNKLFVVTAITLAAIIMCWVAKGFSLGYHYLEFSKRLLGSLLLGWSVVMLFRKPKEDDMADQF